MTTNTNAIEPVATRRGNIFAATDVAAIVNPVNCVGVMGKGLARQFASRYPQILVPYQRACHNGDLNTSRVQVLHVSDEDRPCYVVNLATKAHWRNPSRIEWVAAGLDDMYQQLTELGADSVAVPLLGAGLGGLPFSQVRTVIEQSAAVYPNIRTVIFAP